MSLYVLQREKQKIGMTTEAVGEGREPETSAGAPNRLGAPNSTPGEGVLSSGTWLRASPPSSPSSANGQEILGVMVHNLCSYRLLIPVGGEGTLARPPKSKYVQGGVVLSTMTPEENGNQALPTNN